jgi:hypothetical protein
MSNVRRRRDNFQMPDIPEMDSLPGYQVTPHIHTYSLPTSTVLYILIVVASYDSSKEQVRDMRRDF